MSIFSSFFTSIPNPGQQYLHGPSLDPPQQPPSWYCRRSVYVAALPEKVTPASLPVHAMPRHPARWSLSAPTMSSRHHQPYLSSSLAIRQEIQRFESVHPSIYAIYDLIELLPDPVVAQQVREHVVCIEGQCLEWFCGVCEGGAGGEGRGTSGWSVTFPPPVWTSLRRTYLHQHQFLR